MDCAKVGNLIRRLRREARLTQNELAERIGISDRTVSKWETGRGAPDVTLLRALSEALKVNIEEILRGELRTEDSVGGNMKKTKYFWCPVCGNLSLATGNASVSCCGRKLEPLEVQKADDAHLLQIEQVEDEWYLSAEHPMEREHYITFIAFATGDRIQLIKQYPEWNLQQRIPKRHGLLLWHCSRHGLFSKAI